MEPTKEVVNIDDFLPMPGSESSGTPNEEVKNINLFKKKEPVDVSFLEENTPKPEDKTPTPAEVAAVVEELNNPGQEQTKKKPTSNIYDTMKDLIDSGVIDPFDDDKPLEEYTAKDFKELLQENISNKISKVKQETPKEFFESLPNELQYAAKYVADGGTDLKNLFKALSQSEEIRQLDPAKKEDQVQIVAQYLQASNFGTQEEIQEEIANWDSSGLLDKKAQQFKPKLDKMHEQIVNQKLQQQEIVKKKQQESMQQYVNNVYDALKEGQINDIKIDKKTQQQLWLNLTQTDYQSMSGAKTNLLWHLMEKYQYQEPNFPLIAEATWLLSDPKGYKEALKTQVKTENSADIVRKLKTEESRKIANGNTFDTEEKTESRKIPRTPRNIFAKS